MDAPVYALTCLPLPGDIYLIYRAQISWSTKCSWTNFFSYVVTTSVMCAVKTYSTTPYWFYCNRMLSLILNMLLKSMSLPGQPHDD